LEIDEPRVQDAPDAKVKTGTFGLTTVSVEEIVPPLYPVEGAWIAEIVVVPRPTSVTVFPEIVATAGFELVYVNAPEPALVGAVIVYDPSVIVLV
jgi:hypothetical protein